ncbi:Mannosyltransferase related to Gpi18 [Williamsia sterculiae]|uniref:Mannosyltransferase related to Gpi18 n=2 Tax=Williamsia sterculiae TaxID=1344003 RepID=A0A1N7CLJ0_9NOCA|nr:Mannosyltransferase related to Gpi18 [Williamsia sterculiae]
MRWSVIAAILIIGLGIRYAYLDERTMDYTAFLSRWYDTIADNGGFSALKDKFADYNYPYLYLIAVLTYLHIPSLVGIKAISIVFDLVLAFFAYRIVGLRTARFSVRAAALGVVFLLPSVIANSAWWGQADGIYSAFALGGIYFLLRARRDVISSRASRIDSLWACVFFGIALGFKLQAVFVFPVLLWLLLRRRLPWYALLAIPAVYLALDIPALAVGADWKTVLSVYLDQTDSYKKLTLGAANLYQLLPISGDVTWLAYAGIATAAGLIAAFLAWSLWKRPPVTPASILVVATASAVVVPFLLPAMHDRYFYTAEVLSVVMAFYLPLRFILIPLLVQAAAIGVYHSSLSGDQGQGFGGGGRGGPGSGGTGSGSGRPGGMGSGGGAPSGTPGGGGPSGGNGGRPGGGGGGAPSGGPGGGGSGGYTSGRGDAMLSAYAACMAAAAVGLLYAVVDTLRRAWPSGAHRFSRPVIATTRSGRRSR